MNKFQKFLNKKGISESEFKEMSADEVAKLQSEFMSEQFKNVATQGDLDNLKKELAESDAFKGLSNKIDTVFDELAQIKENTSFKMKDADKFELKKTIKENHEDIVDAIKNKKPLVFEFKAEVHRTDNGTVIAPLNVQASTNIMTDSDVVTIRVPENFILNMISSRQVSKVPSSRTKIEQASAENNIGLTAEGGVKRLNQYKFVKTITDRVKIAGRIEWTEEFEMDYELLFAEIVRMFERDLMLAWQDNILEQVRNNATSYVSSKLDGTFPQPNGALAIIAGKAQLTGFNHNPNVVAINPADYFPIMFQQNANGDSKILPYISNGRIDGMTLIMSNVVPEGKALMGDDKLYDEIHSDFMLRTGQYNDQLITNQYTMIGEVFSLLSIAEIDRIGWLELDLDVVKSVLKKV